MKRSLLVVSLSWLLMAAGFAQVGIGTATPDSNSAYRLKQVDIDGASRYSPIVSVQSTRGISYSVFPNPATDKFILHIHVTETVDGNLELVDVSGKIVSVKMVHLAPGSNNCEWDISRLARGLYFLHARGLAMPVLEISKQ